MKNWNVLMLLFLSTMLFAQEYTPLLQAGKTWDIYAWTAGSITPYDSGIHCYIGEDTIVNGQIYKQIIGQNILASESPVFYPPFELSENDFLYAMMREDEISKQVFTLIANTNTGELQEYLTYDFGLSPGDTIQVPEIPDIDDNGCCFFEARLDSIHIINLPNNSSVRQFEFSLLNGNQEKRYYTEGIGGSNLLLPFTYDFEFGSNILCVRQNEQSLWEMGAYGCQLVVSQEDLLLNNALKIFPNPISNRLNIESDQPIDKLILYNINGQMLFQEQYASRHFSVDFPGTIPAGFYILVLHTNKKLAFFKLQKQ